MAFSKSKRRERIKKGVRKKLFGSTERPRLTVFRSNKEIYAQIINDETAETLVAASSRDKGIEKAGTKSEVAGLVGEQLAKAALDKGVEKVAFDRNGYLFHGRVRALAEGARKGGLNF